MSENRKLLWIGNMLSKFPDINQTSPPPFVNTAITALAVNLYWDLQVIYLMDFVYVIDYCNILERYDNVRIFCLILSPFSLK